MKTPGLVRHGLGLLALALAACGGGGGGSSTTSGSAASLIPAAPAAGAVLYSDAAALRPLRAQSEWTYHGRNRSGGGSTRYQSSVRHGDAAGGVIEQSTGVLNDTWYPETVVNSNGTILETQTIDFLGNGVTEKFTVTELRSPVRQGDQYTLYERSFPRSGFDVDADRIEDSVDVAAYRSVVGNEDVQLADKSAVRALRVDMSGLVRFRRSSDGTYTAAQKIVQSTWYASGIGIVRRRLQTPDVSGDNAVDLDEVLVTWDGVVEGRGHTAPLRAVVPGSTQGNQGLGLGLVPALGAVGLDDAALIVSISPSPAAAESGGIVVSALDKRGAVTASREYPGLLRPAGLGANDSFAAFARLGNGAALLTTPSNFATDNRLFVFDANAQLVNGSAGVVLPLSSARVLVEMAWDGSKLWVLWFKVSYTPSTREDLVLRAFDAQGNPVTPEHVLEPGVDGTQVTDAHLSADSGQVVATWASTGFYERALRYAVLTPAPGTPVVTTFVATRSVPQLNAADKTLRPVAGVGAAALVWSGQILTDTDSYTGPSVDRSLRGVRLDSTSSVTRSTTGAINTELLRVTSSPTDAVLRTANLGGALVVSNSQLYGKFYDDDLAETNFSEIAQFPVGTSALASATPTLTRVRQSGNATGAEMGSVQHVVALSDRVLLIGGSGTVVTSILWKR